MWKHRFEQFMWVFVLASQSWLIVQAVDVFKTKNANGLSALAWSSLVAVHIIWIIYARFVLQPSNGIILANSSMSLILSILILVGILIY
jgi:uncharacterized protein with PQ loop repeat